MAGSAKFPLPPFSGHSNSFLSSLSFDWAIKVWNGGVNKLIQTCLNYWHILCIRQWDKWKEKCQHECNLSDMEWSHKQTDRRAHKVTPQRHRESFTISLLINTHTQHWINAIFSFSRALFIEITTPSRNDLGKKWTSSTNTILHESFAAGASCDKAREEKWRMR